MRYYKYSFCLYFLTFFIYSTGGTSSIDFAKEFYLLCFEFLRLLVDKNEISAQSQARNVVISPLSVSAALTLLSHASNGNTLQELRRGLHLNGVKTITANEFLDLYELLYTNIGNSTLSVANKIYVKQGHRLNKLFQKVIVRKFLSEIEPIDFSDTDKCARIMSNFVEEETDGKIRNLIDGNKLSADSGIVLVNAVYFKGNWEHPFDQTDTFKGNFFINETESVLVDFMHTTGSFSITYLGDLEALALEMKYANSDFSFVIVLPNERTGLRALEEKLKEYSLIEIIQNFLSSKQFVSVVIPKFSVEFEIRLNDVLQKLGIVEIFTGNADLSGLFESGNRLPVSDVVHKTSFGIDEEGVEAQVEAKIVLTEQTATPDEDYEPLGVPQVAFYADHPFFYFIRATRKNTIIISGRVDNLS